MRQKKWFVLIALVVAVMLMLSGCGSSDEEEVAAEPEEVAVVSEEEVEVTEQRQYDGAYRFAGEKVVGVEGSNIILDTTIEPEDDFTDIVVGEAGPDYEGNELTPGSYEFQFVEFPEQNGSWYLYINDDIKVTGNPQASDYSAGNVYELNEGDVVSVHVASIATFYKVVE